MGISPAQYDRICDVIDAAKVEGDQDTDAYAAEILSVLGLEVAA